MQTPRGLNVFVTIGARMASSIGSTASAIEKRFGAMNKRLRLAAAETSAATKIMARENAGLLGLAAAGGIAFTVKSAIGAGGEYDHELQALRNAGRTSQEVAEAIAAANKTILQLPTTTLAGNLAMINETTSAFGNYSHAIENVGRNQKLALLLNNTVGGKGGGDQTEQIGSLIRMLEMRGAANDPARYSRETELAYKAIQFSKGRANGEGFRAFASTANPLIKTLSDRYLYSIAPSLMTEYGAETAGTMHQALMNQIMGKVGVGGKVYAQGWASLGLLDPKMARHAKNGSMVGWQPGAIAGTNLFMQDPLAWSEKFLIPALQKHGVNTNDPMAVQKAVAKLAGRNTAARLLLALTSPNDLRRLHKDEAFTAKVPGVDRATLDTMLKDPTKGPEALKASLTNLGAAISGPILLPLARGLVSLADGVNRLALVFQAHPTFAKVVGGFAVALGAFASFGLAKAALGLVIPFAKIGALLLGAGKWIRGAILGVRLLIAVAGGIGPMLAEGLAAGLAFLSNPVGWAILAGLVVVALAFAFRKQLAPIFTKVWNGLKDLILKVDWKAVGWAVADTFTFGLASRLPATFGAVKDALGGGSKPAHRALGGGVSGGSGYLVGENGPELFSPGRSGSITPARATAAMLAAMTAGAASAAVAAPPAIAPTIIVQGCHDPKATAEEVERVLARLVREARGFMND
jgi:hypothetical protein